MKPLLFGRKARLRRTLGKLYVEINPEHRVEGSVPAEFDETTETDIADIAVSVGASGARRPPSE